MPTFRETRDRYHGQAFLAPLQRITGAPSDTTEDEMNPFSRFFGPEVAIWRHFMEHLQVTTVGRMRTVPIGGTIRETGERQVRWTQILRWHVPSVIVGPVLVLLLVLASAIVAPLPAAVLLTVLHLAVNGILGVRRWTVVLAYPAVFVFVPLIVYALARRTFVGVARDTAGLGNST